MKKEISENVVKVRRKSDRVTAIVLTLSKEVIQLYVSMGHKAEGQTQRNLVFMMKWRVSEKF